MAKKAPAKPEKPKIKASNNKALAVESGPNHQAALEYIDKLMQKAPGTRQEHITGQQALLQLGQAIQQLKKLTAALDGRIQLEAEIGSRDRKIKKLQEQIVKLKGK